MLSEDSLRSLAETFGIEAVWKDETGSTNADAMALAHAGAPHGSLVVAGHQTAGRGRLGRSWETTPGSSLLVSVILRPDLEAERLSLVSLACSLAMIDAVGSACRLTAELKWPNDVVLRDRKLAGVLPEAKLSGDRTEFVVVGVGVNMRQRAEDFPPEVRDRATSVALAGGDPDDVKLLRSYVGALPGELRPQDPEWPREVVSRARAVCNTLGREVRATTVDGRVVEGHAADLDDRGGLVVASGRRRETVAFGEVHHLR